MKCEFCAGRGYVSRYSRRRVGYTTCEHRDQCVMCGGTGEKDDREDAAIDALIVLAFRGECPHGLPQDECPDCTGEEPGKET